MINIANDLLIVRIYFYYLKFEAYFFLSDNKQITLITGLKLCLHKNKIVINLQKQTLMGCVIVYAWVLVERNNETQNRADGKKETVE